MALLSAYVKSQSKFTLMVGQLIMYAYWLEGYDLSFGDAWRSTSPLKIPGITKTFTFQELLFFNGYSKVKYSRHNDRLAVDFVLRFHGELVTKKTAEAWRPLGEFWEKIGGRWGGRFGVKKGDYALKIGWDPGHFET